MVLKGKKAENSRRTPRSAALQEAAAVEVAAGAAAEVAVEVEVELDDADVVSSAANKLVAGLMFAEAAAKVG